MNPHLMQLQLSLWRFSKDASPLLDGEPAFSEETVKINKDEVCNNLLEVNDDEFPVLTDIRDIMPGHSYCPGKAM